LTEVLRRQGFSVAAEVSDPAAAGRACCDFRPDVCLIGRDIHGGPDLACRWIASEHPEVDAVLLASDSHDEWIGDALAAGAVGFVPLSATLDRLPGLVRRARSGDFTLTRAVVDRLVATFDRCPAELAPRERAVLAGTAAGLPPRVIAVRLSMPLAEVHAAVRTIMRQFAAISASVSERRHDVVAVG
jgi:DNA-binding NarL/FixJ family response regulator